MPKHKPKQTPVVFLKLITGEEVCGYLTFDGIHTFLIGNPLVVVANKSQRAGSMMLVPWMPAIESLQAGFICDIPKTMVVGAVMAHDRLANYYRTTLEAYANPEEQEEQQGDDADTSTPQSKTFH